ncbi:MAG: RecQ family ATP-dependent DNA helicase [Spirochaetota bacterium]
METTRTSIRHLASPPEAPAEPLPEPPASPLPDPVAETARERFGIPWLFPIQRLVMANILEAASLPATEQVAPADPGDNHHNAEEAFDRPPPRQVVVLPTGAGKSLCFQVPALLLEGPTLVLYPLLALMEDQRRRLQEQGIPSVTFRGGQSAAERRNALSSLASGETRIAIANPEVLEKGKLAGELAGLGIAHLAIDEAHCVSEWGASFRPAYLEVGRIARELKPRAITAFTATAGPAVLEATAASLFGDAAWRLLAGNPDRPNIVYSVVPTLSKQRSLARLVAESEKPLIIFAGSRRGVENLASRLRLDQAGLDARFYHAGLAPEEKRRIEAWFLASSEGVLVATCAYGMGVDKKNIRTVIHWEAPATVEAYLQESGRAGRDGGQSRAILLRGVLGRARGEGSSSGEAAAGAAGEGGRETKERSVRAAALEAYATSTSGCRREALLALLGAVPEGSCSGCDRCSGEAIEEPEGEEAIRSFLRANPRRFDESTAIARLRGERGLDPPLVPGAASLSTWHRAEVAEALKALIRLGRIRVLKGFPWEDRLHWKRVAVSAPPRTSTSRFLIVLDFRFRLALLRLRRFWSLGSLYLFHFRGGGLALRDHADKTEQAPDSQDRDGDSDGSGVHENTEGDTLVLVNTHSPAPPRQGQVLAAHSIRRPAR